MTEQEQKGQEELEDQDGQPLPDREVMSVITPDPTADGFVHHDEAPPTTPDETKYPIDWLNEPEE